MKKIAILTTTILLVLSGGFFSCGKELVSVEIESVDIPSWSYAVKYQAFLNRLKCLNSVVTINNEEFSGEAVKESPITGTWKLLLDFNAGDTVDYSCHSILYSFNTDSLVIRNDYAETPTAGTFRYDYYPDPFCALCDILNPNPNLVIGNQEYFCQVARSWLVVYAAVRYDEGVNRGEIKKILCRIY